MSSEQLRQSLTNTETLNYHSKPPFSFDTDNGIIEDTFESGVRTVPVTRELLTVKEVCEILRLSRNSVHELRKQGKLEEVRMGKKNGAVRIYRDSLERYLDDRQSRTEEAIEVRNRLHDVRRQARFSKQ
jgi:excisionase family DNA binding protein